MKRALLILAAACGLWVAAAFATVNAMNGVTITTASSILGKTPNSAVMGQTIAAAAPSGTAFVTGQTVGTLRSDGGGYLLGFQMTTGVSTITVTHVGRYKNSGDSATHAVVFLDNGNAPVSGGSANVDMSQAASSDGYVYVALASPIVLGGTTNYKLGSVEVNGVDQFGDSNGTVTTTLVAAVTSAFYSSGGAAGGGATGNPGGVGNSYTPVSFKYSSP